ncbi:hypothetical protein [Spirulina major]|uniref:hypothetical protein n=1 Tax=Spirulina major TaxID=270636 RepID=UPI000933EB12|nr:hypothetical protein [Spirulina major]
MNEETRLNIISEVKSQFFNHQSCYLEVYLNLSAEITEGFLGGIDEENSLVIIAASGTLTIHNASHEMLLEVLSLFNSYGWMIFHYHENQQSETEEKTTIKISHYEYFLQRVLYGRPLRPGTKMGHSF